MCGIGAIISINWNDRHSTWLEMLRKSLLHRGPDGNGTVKAGEQTGLVHTRLAFLDLSERGAQPMWSSCRRYCITFNGEIYNFRQLKAELEKSGVAFHTNSDTEVILAAFKEWGEDSFQRLRGMFAFIIRDEKENCVYLVRDVFGIKPLYFCQLDDALCAASELRSLAALFPSTPRLSEAGLFSFFLFGSVYEPYTILDSVQQLPAGSYLRWQDGKSSITAYGSIWDSPEKSETINDPAAASDFLRNLLEDSVSAHCIADVPVGVLLSGGLDSTLVLRCARDNIENLHTFTIGFDRPESDESSAAATTAKIYKTHHHLEILSRQSCQTLWTDFVKTMDQPTIDGLNVFAVCKMLKDQGIKAALSGLGGDELFNGYSTFRRLPVVDRCSSMFPRKLTAPLQPLVSSLPAPYGRILDAASAKYSHALSYQALRGTFPLSIAAKLAVEALQYFDGRKEILPSPELLLPVPVDVPLDAHTISRMEISGYMRNQLLRDSDVFAMAHGIELRVPFVDYYFYSSLQAINNSLRLKPGKEALKQAFPDLPSHVTQQPKKGFIIPFRSWIEEDFDTEFARAMKAKGISASAWYCRWSLYILERWVSMLRQEPGNQSGKTT